MAEREPRITAEDSVDTPDTDNAVWICTAERVARPLMLRAPAAPIVVDEYREFADSEPKITVDDRVDVPETERAFWTQRADTVRRAEIVVADVIPTGPFTVRPDAVIPAFDRPTPPIVEFAAEIVELIM